MKTKPTTTKKASDIGKSALPTQIKDSPSLVKMTKILVPIDFSDAGKVAFEYAKSFAKLTGAKIYLVHVLEYIYAGAEISYIPFDMSELRERVSRRIGALQMEEFRGFKTDYAMCQGLPFQEIVSVAEREKADLIVMATHGYTGIKHILIGSTTERVVRNAPCPVLVVRSKQRARGGARKGET